MSEPQASQLERFEAAELEQREAIIERGLQTFLDVGNALLEIREKRLYRDYGTFKDYLRDRWGMSRRRGYQLVDAAETMGNLVHNCAQPLPQNEAQARPLAVLEPEQQREAWNLAVETAPNGRPTAKHVAKVAATFRDVKLPAALPSPGRTDFSAEEDAEKDAGEDVPEPGPDRFGEDWLDRWKEQNLFLVSLPQRGGIVNLTRKWPRERRESAIHILRDLASTALQCAAELEEEELNNEPEPPESY